MGAARVAATFALIGCVEGWKLETCMGRRVCVYVCKQVRFRGSSPCI